MVLELVKPEPEPQPQIIQVVEVIEEPLPVLTVEEKVKNYFGEDHIMVDIAWCESQFRQYDNDGVVLKNPTSSASGVFQIMKSIHYEEALSLGFDITSTEGNIEYAKYLYDKNGTSDWNASINCWSKML